MAGTFLPKDWSWATHRVDPWAVLRLNNCLASHQRGTGLDADRLGTRGGWIPDRRLGDGLVFSNNSSSRTNLVLCSKSDCRLHHSGGHWALGWRFPPTFRPTLLHRVRPPFALAWQPLDKFSTNSCSARESTRQLVTFALILGRLLPIIVLTPLSGGKSAPIWVKMGVGVTLAIMVAPVVYSQNKSQRRPMPSLS